MTVAMSNVWTLARSVALCLHSSISGRLQGRSGAQTAVMLLPLRLALQLEPAARHLEGLTGDLDRAASQRVGVS